MTESLLSSGAHDGVSYLLSGVTKKKYRIDKAGFCSPVEADFALRKEVEFYEDCPGMLAADFDMYPFKRFTDVVVKGTLRGSGSETSMMAEVNVNNDRHRILAHGDRKAYLATGSLRFTEPNAITEIPLRYDFAYGGLDNVAFEKHALALPDSERDSFLETKNWIAGGPYQYPRNPFGKGYVTDTDAAFFQEVELPNLEDPDNYLTTGNLRQPPILEWYRSPLPRATDWMNHEIFPRLTFIGFRPALVGDTSQTEEFVKGLVPPEALAESLENNSMDLTSRFANGASLGLQFPYLRPGASIQLVNIHDTKRNFVLRLPNEFPEIKVDGRNGKMLDTQPKIITVEVDTHLNELSIVWAGSAPAIRLYFDEELVNMPLVVNWNRG